MTKVPIGPSTSAEHWRQFGGLALQVGKKLAALGSKWSTRMRPHLIALLHQLERASTPSPPPLPGRLTQERVAPKPLPVAARDYVYNFNIRASFTWSSEGVSPDFLSWSVQNLMPQAIDSLRWLAADCARSFEADQPQKLQEELRRRLSKMGGWRYVQSGYVIRCQPHVRVDLDDPVKELIRPQVDARITFRHQHELHLAQAQSAKQLSDQWVTILQRHVQWPVTGGAHNPRIQEFVSALQRMMSMQKEAAEWIEDLLSKRARDDETRDSEPLFASEWPDESPEKAA